MWLLGPNLKNRQQYRFVWLIWNYKSNYWHPLTLSFLFQNEQSTPTNPPTAYPDWSQFQVCKMELCCIAFFIDLVDLFV